MRTGIEPGHSPAHDYDFQLPALQIGLVDVSDLKFAPSRRFQALRNANYLTIIKIKSSHCVARFRLFRLLLQAQRAPFLIEFDNSVALRIVHRVCEHYRSTRLLPCVSQVFGKIMSVKDVVPEDQCAGALTNKVLSHQEGLRNAFGLRLDRT